MACHVIHDVTVGNSLRQHLEFVRSIFVHWLTILPPSHTNDVAAYEISTVEIVPISTKMQYHDYISIVSQMITRQLSGNYSVDHS